LRARDGGLVGYLMQHSHTLGAALERLVRFSYILDFQQHFAAGEMLGLTATTTPQNSDG
jgi:hypothetical protein